MNIGTISSIYTRQASLAVGSLSTATQSLGSSPSQTASDVVAGSGFPTISRLTQKAQDAADAAAVAGEGREAMQTAAEKVKRLEKLISEYHSGDAEQTDDDRAAIAEEFAETKAALLEQIDTAEVGGKTFFSEGTRYTFRTNETVSQTVTLDASLDRGQVASIELTDDATADAAIAARAVTHVENVQRSYEAGADRLDAASARAERELELAESDVQRRLDSRQARALLSSTMSDMLANASYAMLTQANIAGQDALAMLS
jgi:flagellin-like hook-associated protein FlgL